MAVGRISGPLLKSNLIRNGIDLAFETDLLYLDVNNQRIGVKNSSPQYDLDITGTMRSTNINVDNNLDIANINVTGNTISTSEQYLNLGTLDNIVYQNKARIDGIDIQGNIISTNDSNSNLEFRPNGTGEVHVHSDMNVTGNIHATGNITADGDITLGDADTDNLVINADIASNIIPDQSNTYTLGEAGKIWNDVHVNNLFADTVNTTALNIGDIDLTLRQGNIIYVSENGDDAHTGTHPQDPVASIAQGLSLATAGDTVMITPGVYTEVFPLTVPVGVTLKGAGIRSVTIQPTTATRYNDAVLLNGESTVEDLTIKDYYSGGAFHDTTAASAGSATLNVGTAPFAHTYVSGGTITFGGTDYAITNAVYTHGTGQLVITHAGPDAGVGTSTFIKDIVFSCNGGNRTFPDNGYAFRFATDFEVTSRSPYIRNITTITKGSTTTAEDPRGFNAGDAGKGPYVDGAYATANSKEASMLFHSCTFITPGVDGLTATNGARIEWLNSFTYFANRGIHAFDSNDGIKGDGKTRIRLSGITGTFNAADTVTFTSTDASTVEIVTVESVDNDILVIDGKNTNFIGFDKTPQSISNGAGATATIIENVDLQDFGAEIRMIGSACVYGNFGLVGNGPGVIVYAIGQNLAYIGNGKEVTNDPETVIQANEVVELDNAKVRYNSVDHKGDFRVGDLFYVNQDDGTVSFTANALTVDLTTGATFTTGGESSFINGSRIDVGNLRLTGNTLSSTVGDINFNSSSGVINLLDNVDITGNLDVSGDVTIGGNITIGDEGTDSIEIVAGINSNLVPSSTSTFSLGTNTNSWSKLWVSELQVDDVNINTNVITTTSSNADLELRANGTGSVVAEGFTFETNNISTTGDMVFDAGSELINFNSSGAIRLPTGTTAQRTAGVAGELRYNSELARFEGFNGSNWFNLKGVEDLDGDTRITAELTEGANDDIIRFYVKNDVVFSVDTNGFNANQIEIDNIRIDGNVINTTSGDLDLVLSPNGTGSVVIDNFSIKDNTITHTVPQGIMEFQKTGVNAYYKFDGSYGLVIPVGTSLNRPATPEIGMIRFNTADLRVEVFDGSIWTSVAGLSGAVSSIDATNIAIENVLFMG